MTESIYAPALCKANIMPSSLPDALYSRAEIGILACSKCGNPMRLSQIEPAAPGYDVRTFECVKCNSDQRFLVAI